MIRLANERNVDQVLLEFKEYATEVDVDFVRKVSSMQIQNVSQGCYTSSISWPSCASTLHVTGFM